ncbi:hypothetical protein [Gangjinia marincola]
MLLPLSSIGLLFLKDDSKTRGLILNILLVLNAILFVLPILYAYINTRPDGNMFNENGPGAILWAYIILGPLCLGVQLILAILKFVFRRKTTHA